MSRRKMKCGSSSDESDTDDWANKDKEQKHRLSHQKPENDYRKHYNKTRLDRGTDLAPVIHSYRTRYATLSKQSTSDPAVATRTEKAQSKPVQLKFPRSQSTMPPMSTRSSKLRSKTSTTGLKSKSSVHSTSKSQPVASVDNFQRFRHLQRRQSIMGPQPRPASASGFPNKNSVRQESYNKKAGTIIKIELLSTDYNAAAEGRPSLLVSANNGCSQPKAPIRQIDHLNNNGSSPSWNPKGNTGSNNEQNNCASEDIRLVIVIDPDIFKRPDPSSTDHQEVYNEFQDAVSVEDSNELPLNPVIEEPITVPPVPKDVTFVPEHISCVFQRVLNGEATLRESMNVEMDLPDKGVSEM